MGQIVWRKERFIVRISYIIVSDSKTDVVSTDNSDTLGLQYANKYVEGTDNSDTLELQYANTDVVGIKHEGYNTLIQNLTPRFPAATEMWWAPMTTHIRVTIC